jgi:hypothetical protein
MLIAYRIKTKLIHKQEMDRGHRAVSCRKQRTVRTLLSPEGNNNNNNNNNNFRTTNHIQQLQLQSKGLKVLENVCNSH